MTATTTPPQEQETLSPNHRHKQEAREEKRREECSILYQYTIPKTKQLVLKPQPDGSWNIEINAFRELHTRNQLSMSKTLMEKAVRPFLREHNWPPGNSQTQLFPKQVTKSLCNCGRPATRDVTLQGGMKLFCCSLHMPGNVVSWKELKR